MKTKTAIKIINNHLKGDITEISKKIFSEIADKAIKAGMKPPFGIKNVDYLADPFDEEDNKNKIELDVSLAEEVASFCPRRDGNKRGSLGWFLKKVERASSPLGYENRYLKSIPFDENDLIDVYLNLELELENEGNLDEEFKSTVEKFERFLIDKKIIHSKEDWDSLNENPNTSLEASFSSKKVNNMKTKTAIKIINNHLKGDITEISKKIFSEIADKVIVAGMKPPFGIKEIRTAARDLDDFLIGPQSDEGEWKHEDRKIIPETEEFEEKFSDKVFIPKNLALKIMDWHNGQGSPTYAVGSTAFAGKKVPVNLVEDAIKELEDLFEELHFEGNTSPHDKEHFEIENIFNRLKKILKIHENKNKKPEESYTDDFKL